jgi:hypothetical protein
VVVEACLTTFGEFDDEQVELKAAEHLVHQHLFRPTPHEVVDSQWRRQLALVEMADHPGKWRPDRKRRAFRPGQ